MSSTRQVLVNFIDTIVVCKTAPKSEQMKLLIISVFLSLATTSFSQDNRYADYADFTGAFGSSQGSVSVDYFHLWKLGKSKKMEVGLGGRFTSYFGTSQYFSSAPASLAADEDKSDSLLLQSP